MTSVSKIIIQLTTARDRESLHVTLARACVEAFGAHSMGLYEVIGEAAERRWVTRCEVGVHPGRPLVNESFEGLDDCPALNQYPERAAALDGAIMERVDLNAHVTIFPCGMGVAEIHSPQALTDEDKRRTLEVLEAYRNLVGLLDYGQRDSLTGLLNRKTFDAGFLKAATVAPDAHARNSEERRLCDPQLRSWVGMVDIDHFKAVNDRFGHLIGDEVLLLLGQILHRSCRRTDQIFRFGGEEFVLLIQCAHASDARMVFERVRSNTEHFEFPQVQRVTVSIGFTEVSGSDSPSSALGRADKAVYFVKSNGRNQVQHYGELVERSGFAVTEVTGEVELF